MESYHAVPDYVAYSLVGGTFASLGSLLGKLSGSFEEWLTSLMFFATMIISNMIGAVLFAKSLNLSTSSIQPTLISSASTYVVTAVFGVIFYGESTSILWWTGTILILLGVILMSKQEKPKSE